MKAKLWVACDWSRSEFRAKLGPDAVRCWPALPQIALLIFSRSVGCCTRRLFAASARQMAAVGPPMDDSYAERARKAAAAPKSRNNVKSMVSPYAPEPVGVPSSSTSETLDSSPALSVAQTTTTSLALPLSIPISSASSDQASPVRASPRNAWSERGLFKTPQKAQSTTTPAVPHANADILLIKPDATTRVRPGDTGHTPTKLGQTPSTRTKNDPFVVKYNHVAPNLTDAQSWPQIGEASSPRHTRPSASSVSSVTMVSGSQTPANPASESEGDQLGAKRKGKSLMSQSFK